MWTNLEPVKQSEVRKRNYHIRTHIFGEYSLSYSECHEKRSTDYVGDREDGCWHVGKVSWRKCHWSRDKMKKEWARRHLGPWGREHPINLYSSTLKLWDNKCLWFKPLKFSALFQQQITNMVTLQQPCLLYYFSIAETNYHIIWQLKTLTQFLKIIFSFDLFIFNWKIPSCCTVIGFYQASTWINHRFSCMSSHFNILPPASIPLSS